MEPLQLCILQVCCYKELYLLLPLWFFHLFFVHLFNTVYYIHTGDLYRSQNIQAEIPLDFIIFGTLLILLETAFQ